MKIDFTAPITDLAGKPVETRDDSGEPVPMTLATVAIHALLTPLPGAHGQPELLTAMDKVRHGQLAQAIYNASGPIDVPIKDVAMLKERIGIACTTLTVTRAFALLDPDAS